MTPSNHSPELLEVSIRELRLGTVVPFGPKGEPSAYRKSPVTELVEVREAGLVGDNQADLEHHGGIDKAILHYAYDHYPRWREERSSLADRFAESGAFGENISTLGIVEFSVCIGDQLRLGTAVVEVSQGRQPCWKLGHSFGDQTMVQDVIRTRRSGWYYRVLQKGTVGAGDTLELLERPFPQWTVDRVFGHLVGRDRDTSAIEELSQMEVLAGAWRERARRLFANLTRNSGAPDTSA